MKNLTLLTISAVFLFFITGCKGGAGNLDEGTATDVITAHLKANPEFESVRINVGEMKFRSKNDKVELEKYKGLQGKGLVEMTLQDQKKKFLSKDSVYIYQVSLTDKSKPYVLKQDASKATLRVLDYVLDPEKPITLIKGDSKVARVTVSLKKEQNDFAIFLKDKGTTSNFITKTYKLKFKKEEGWVLIGD
jgi:hypothetical protein